MVSPSKFTEPTTELLQTLIRNKCVNACLYRTRVSTAYGTGLLSPGVALPTFGARFRGNDERIDLESRGLSGNFFDGTAKELVG
ncbi:MAG: hypothetical protein AAGF73_11560 [Actinomycetota bacterium]